MNVLMGHSRKEIQAFSYTHLANIRLKAHKSSSWKMWGFFGLENPISTPTQPWNSIPYYIIRPSSITQRRSRDKRVTGAPPITIIQSLGLPHQWFGIEVPKVFITVANNTKTSSIHSRETVLTSPSKQVFRYFIVPPWHHLLLTSLPI